MYAYYKRILDTALAEAVISTAVERAAAKPSESARSPLITALTECVVQTDSEREEDERRKREYPEAGTVKSITRELGDMLHCASHFQCYADINGTRSLRSLKMKNNVAAAVVMLERNEPDFLDAVPALSKEEMREVCRIINMKSSI